MQEETPAAAPGPSFPLGFRTVVAGLAIAQTISWAILYYGFSSFVLPMMRETGWPKATLMGAYTLALLVWGLANYAVGAAIDRGHGRAVMSGGTVLGALSCAAWAMVSEPWMLYAALAAAGAAMAMTLYEPAFNILTKRYPTRYRDGITALTLVAGFASTVSFPTAAWLIGAIGWRAALLVLAAVLLVVIAPLNAWLLRGPALVAVPVAPDAQADATLHGALRVPAFWLLTLAFTLHAFAGAGMWAHVMPAFEHKGLPESQALLVVALIGPAQVAGRFIWASLGRGLSLHRLGVLVTAGMPLAMALFALSTSLLPLMGFAIVFGLANGMVTIVRGGIVPEYFGRSHVGRIGGAMSAVSLVARAAAPLAVAGLLLLLAGYTQAMLAMAALGVVATLAFALAKPPRA
ncbi:MAG: MFS transporter [Rubrivivax sp.]